MKRQLVLMAVSVLIISLAGQAQTEGYNSRSYARLSHVSGEVQVQRAGDMGYEAGTVNLALIKGDKLAIQEGRAEVSFGRQNYVRLDRLTQIEFVNLPAGGNEPYKIHLLNGKLYLRISSMNEEKEFEAHTPDASFYILDLGLYRLDVSGRGETRLSVVEGRAEAAGETGSLEVNAGQSLMARNGNLVSGPDSLYAEADDFGRWNQSRDTLLPGRASSSYLPQELGEYESELDEHGQWHYEADYGYVWVPEVDYYDNWRPYYYGRWVWYPIIGWTWVPDEPWGWCVYHYGRWHWRLNLGWYWIPTRHWGPAWVHWYWDNHYFGWCPLNWWNRPVVVINNVFYANYGHSFHSAHNRAWTVIHRNQLQARRIPDVALRGGALERVGRVNMSGRQPSLSPNVLRSGRLHDQAQRTFERSAGRPVGRIYSNRSLSGGEGSLFQRGSAREGSGISNARTGLSSRRIREFTPDRQRSLSLPNRTSSSDSGRTLRSTAGRRTVSGLSSSSQPREFSSRTSTRRSGSAEPSLGRSSQNRGISRGSGQTYSRTPVRSREFSSRLSSRDRSGSFSPLASRSSSSRSSAWSTRFPSRSAASPSYRRPSYNLTSRSSSPSNRRLFSSSPSSSPSSQRSYLRSRNDSLPRSSDSRRSSSSPSRYSFFSNRSSSSSGRSYSTPNRSYSSPSRTFSAPSRSHSSPNRSYSAPNSSHSSSNRSDNSSSSSRPSSSRSSPVRRRNR